MRPSKPFYVFASDSLLATSCCLLARSTAHAQRLRLAWPGITAFVDQEEPVAPPGSCLLAPLAPPGCSWLLLGPPSYSWLLLGPHDSSWLPWLLEEPE